MKTFITKNTNKLFYTLGFVFLLLIWIILSITYNNNVILPGPVDTLKALFKLVITLNTYKVLFSTLLRLFISLIISFILSFILALLSFWKEELKQFIRPFILILKTLPVASIIVIMIIFVGHNMSPYYITSFVTIPIMFEGILNGLTGIDKGIIDELKTQTNTNSLVIKEVYIPIIRKDINTSLLQSFGLGLKVMVMAEFITQPFNSIGRELIDMKNNLEYAFVFAWSIILILIVILFEFLINKNKKSVA